MISRKQYVKRLNKIFAQGKINTANKIGPEKAGWVERIEELYDAAKERNNGNSLSIYGEVSTIIGYLEGDEELPQGFDLFQECDNLASRLHPRISIKI